MVAFLEQENLTQHGISIPPQSYLQCRRRPVTSRVIDPLRASIRAVDGPLFVRR